MKQDGKPNTTDRASKTVLMLLMNAYDPDPRVRQEALTLIAMGCRVRLLAWDRDLQRPAFEILEGVEVERVFLSSTHGRGTTQVFFYAWLYLKMLCRSWKTSFDVVHCHDLDTLPIGFILGKLKRKPIVYDSHESFPDMLTGSVHLIVISALVALETFFIRRVDLLITVGEKLRRYFAERGATRSVVVGNWKRLEEFSRTEQQNLAMRYRLGIPTGALVVVCITQLLKDRKIEELLDAVSECQNVYVIVGGKGVLQDLIQTAAKINPQILFMGFVSGKQIADYTCAADVVYYGFDPDNPNARFSAPNKLFEALAAGRPVITGDFGEIADVVRQASCGVVLPNYSPVEVRKALELCSDPQFRKSTAENARQFGFKVLNWQKGEEILHREFSTLLRSRLEWPPREPELRTACASGAEVSRLAEGRN